MVLRMVLSTIIVIALVVVLASCEIAPATTQAALQQSAFADD